MNNYHMNWRMMLKVDTLRQTARLGYDHEFPNRLVSKTWTTGDWIGG